MGNGASSNVPAQISIPLSASDPNTAIIVAWLARRPANRSRATLLRAVLATGIQVEAALQRIEAKLDALAAGGITLTPPAISDPPPPEETLQPFLDGLFDFTAAEG